MIRFDQNGEVWTATIDREDKAGALTKEMLTDLADFAERAEPAKVLIITGTGKVFSAGMDLEAAATGLATDSVWERLSSAIAAFRGLSIAALNGTVAGGSMGMVLACDLRVAVPATKFFYPVMQRGFLPQPSDPKRLSALIGPARAKMILMAGQKIAANEALTWGLLDRICATEEFSETIAQLSQDALSANHTHIHAIKDLIP